jgi:hypothetical protein
MLLNTSWSVGQKVSTIFENKYSGGTVCGINNEEFPRPIV